MMIKNKQFIILLVFFEMLSHIQAQEMQLTKQEMYQDFDSLISIIQTNNPHLEIYQKTMKWDVIKKLKEQRKKIDQIKDIAHYFIFIDQCLNLIPEPHTFLLFPEEEEIGDIYKENFNESGSETNAIEKTIGTYDAIDSYITSYEKEDKNRISLPVSYTDGKYIFNRPIKFINKKDTVTYNSGDEITHVNKIPIHSYIAHNHLNYISRLRWDINYKRFYTTEFLWLDSLTYSNADIALTIRSKSNTKILHISPATHSIIEANHLLKNYQLNNSYNRKPVVWCVDSLLYIKIPRMI